MRRHLLIMAVIVLSTSVLGVPAALGIAGSPNIAGAGTITSGQPNNGDASDPFYRVSLYVGDRMTTDITLGSDGACLNTAYLYGPSVTDFTLFNAIPSATFGFDCYGDTQFQWTWISPFHGLGTIDMDAGDQPFNFTTTIRHGTATALGTLTPVRRLGSEVHLTARVTSLAGVPVGYCEFYRRLGNARTWVYRAEVATGQKGGCKLTLTPALRGHWHYRVTFTSNGGDWAKSISAVGSTVIR